MKWKRTLTIFCKSIIGQEQAKEKRAIEKMIVAPLIYSQPRFDQMYSHYLHPAKI